MHIFIRRLAIVFHFWRADESVAWGNYDFSMFHFFENQSNQYLCKNLSLQLTAYTQCTVYVTAEKRLLLLGRNDQFPQCF